MLTVDGKAEVVVQDAEACRRLAQLAAKATGDETVDAIRRGLMDAESGRVKPARRALQTLAKTDVVATTGD